MEGNTRGLGAPSGAIIGWAANVLVDLTAGGSCYFVLGLDVLAEGVKLVTCEIDRNSMRYSCLC